MDSVGRGGGSVSERDEVRVNRVEKGCAEHGWPGKSVKNFGFCSESNGKPLDVFK